MNTPASGLVGAGPTAGAEHRLTEALFRRHGVSVRLYLRNVLGNDEDAADVTQEVFASIQSTLMRGAPAIIDERAWVFRVAHNRAVDAWRKRRWLRLVLRFDDLAGVQEPTQEVTSTSVELLAVRAAIERLSTRSRESVILRYLVQMTTREIARAQGRSEGAVRAELSRALAKLRRDLGGLDDD